MRLSKEEVQFIDNYLLKSEVIYVDIRSEMVDHIATAVELKMQAEAINFYEAFKKYMILHKKEILKHKGAWSIYSRAVIVGFLKFMTHPLRLVVAGLLLILFWNVNVNQFFLDEFTVSNFYSLMILIIAFGQLIYFNFILKQRFFILDKLGGLLLMIYYLQMFFMNQFSKELPGVYTLTALFYFLIAYLWYFTKEVHRFEQRKKLYF